MQAAISARSWLRSTRRPMNLGAGGTPPRQSIGVLFARAAAKPTSAVALRLACCSRTLAESAASSFTNASARSSLSSSLHTPTERLASGTYTVGPS